MSTFFHFYKIMSLYTTYIWITYVPVCILCERKNMYRIFLYSYIYNYLWLNLYELIIYSYISFHPRGFSNGQPYIFRRSTC